MIISEKPEKIRIPKNSSFVDVYADCETSVELKEGEWSNNKEERDVLFRTYGVVFPWLLCFNLPRCGYDPKGNPIMLKHRKTVCSHFPHLDFFKALRQLCDLGHIPIVWFHNTTYDITSLFPVVIKHLDPDAEIYLHVKDINNDFLAGSIYSPKLGFTIVLGDTMKYKKISLGKVGEMFNFPKGSVIYTMTDLALDESKGMGYYRNWETGEESSFLIKDYEEYCSRDVDLLVMYHGYINRFKEELYKAVLGEGNSEKIKAFSTVGEQAKKMFDCFIYRHVRGNFDNYFRPKVSRLEYYRQYKSNNGGFTSMSKIHPFYRCGENEKIFYIDINGSYPHVMSMGLPYGDLLGVKPKSGGYITWIRLQINGFEWDNLFADLTKEGISRDRFKVVDGNFTPDDWFAEKEIYIPEEVFIFLKKRAKIKYKYRGKFYQKITQIAGKYMEFLNNIRKAYKDRAQNHPDETERLLADEIQKNIKIAANSNYGKFCQQSYTLERYYLGDMYADYLKNPDEVDYRGTLTGAYVTWMARLKLFKKIEEIKEAGFTFLYCDTDSIIGVYDTRREDKFLSVVGINTNELGQWKVEGYFDEFAYLVSKKYMLIDYENPEKSRFVFSGISNLNRWITAFKEGLLNKFEETLKVLRGIFSHSQNWVFIDAKNSNIKTVQYGQTIIRISDFNTNAKYKKKKIRHGEIWLTPEGYGYKIYD